MPTTLDAPVMDPADLAVLIPQARRAIDGAGVESSLTDQQILAMLADAVGRITILTRGGFPHALIATSADTDYLAPNGWKLEPAADIQAAAVITSEAAINYLFRSLSGAKTSESLKDEGKTWEYTTSASVLRDWLKYLQSNLEAALESILADGAPVANYVSFIQIRDSQASTAVEPWLTQ